MMAALTDFADPALVLALLLSVGLTAALCGWWRGAAVWLGVGGLTLGVVVVLKVTLFAELVARGVIPPGAIQPGAIQPGADPAGGPAATMMRSPSGHTASAVLVYGGLAMLLGLPTVIWASAAIAAGVLIGVTRVAMSFHSVAEIIAGGAVGLAGVIIMQRLIGTPPQGWRRWTLAGASAATIYSLYGVHLRVEQTIQQIARELAQRLP